MGSLSLVPPGTPLCSSSESEFLMKKAKKNSLTRPPSHQNDTHWRNSLAIDEHTQQVIQIFQNLPGFQALSTSKPKNCTGPESPGLDSEWSANTIRHIGIYTSSKGFAGGSVVKSTCKARATGDMDLISRSGSSPGGEATQSSILAWRIPWTEEPDRLQSTGSQRVRHD